jgi:hypothetical protein
LVIHLLLQPASDKPKWTDVVLAWGGLSASILTLATLITTIAITIADRRRAQAQLSEERQRADKKLREELQRTASEQRRIFYLQTLLKIIDSYVEISSATDVDEKKRATQKSRAYLHAMPDEVASLMRFEYDPFISESSRRMAQVFANKLGRALQRPVPSDWILTELEEDLGQFLPQSGNLTAKQR